MYSPKFSITNDILANIGLIEAAREVVKNAPLIPVYESKFVKEEVIEHNAVESSLSAYNILKSYFLGCSTGATGSTELGSS